MDSPVFQHSHSLVPVGAALMKPNPPPSRNDLFPEQNPINGRSERGQLCPPGYGKQPFGGHGCPRSINDSVLNA